MITSLSRPTRGTYPNWQARQGQRRIVVWCCKEHQAPAGQECQDRADQGELFTRANAANWALGLSTQILLDENLTTARAFGVSGTPMAVLVDGQGKIDSTVEAGTSAFWKLAGTSTLRPPWSTSATA